MVGVVFFVTVPNSDLSLVQELLHGFGREYLDFGRFLGWQLASDCRVLTDELFGYGLFKSGSTMSMDASDD